MEVNSTITPAPVPKSPEPEPESETPTRIHQTVKPLTFTNGVLKRHQSAGGHHHNHHAVVVTYKECLKNHAATLGGHALDGCGEFMPSPSFNSSDPTSLKCAACGCHRNFHRREPEDSSILQIVPGNTNTAIEYQPHHRHHPPPPQPLQNLSSRSPNSASPPPISSSYYPSSAPHMLLALSSPHQDKNSHHSHNHNHNHNPHSHHHHLNILTPNTNLNLPSDAVISPLSNTNSNSRKRFRTKFTQHQKDKMLEFAERLEWKMQKRDEELVHSFCNDVEVDRNVFKVWMHNNKNNFLGKKDHVSINGTGTENLDENDRENHGINNGGHNLNHNHHHHQQQPPHDIRYDNNDATHVGTNGSSSSS